MNHKQHLLNKIATNSETIGIIGLGYVGLPLAVCFAEAGVKVLGFDKNSEKVQKLNKGENYISDIRDAQLREVVDRVIFSATTDFSRIKECDAILICVPTPLDRFKKPDMSYIETACRDIGKHMKPGTFICLESTTYPTTTEDFMLPIIEATSTEQVIAASSESRITNEEGFEVFSPSGEIPIYQERMDSQNLAQGTNSSTEIVPQNQKIPYPFPLQGESGSGVRIEGEVMPKGIKGDEESRDFGMTEGVKARSSKPEALRHGEHFWLAYSPERVDPGNKNYHTKNTPKVLGAMTEDGLEIGKALYSKAIDNIHTVSSPRVAEMVKILENTYRLVNISLINELALLAGKMEINIWEVIDAAATKPFGFQAFYPGPGIGGHCIPLDPFYLEHIAKKYDFELSMIHAAGHINMRMPHYMYIKIATALNRHEKAVRNSKILFLGVAYKPDINDERESPALEIMDIVAHKGGIVDYNDPHIPVIKTNNDNQFQSLDLNEQTLKNADCVVLTTNHSAFDIKFIQQHARLIVDLRNMVKESSDKVINL